MNHQELLLFPRLTNIFLVSSTTGQLSMLFIGNREEEEVEEPQTRQSLQEEGRYIEEKYNKETLFQHVLLGVLSPSA